MLTKPADLLYLAQAPSDPVDVPEEGTTYYNTTTKKVRIYLGGAWVDAHNP